MNWTLAIEQNRQDLLRVVAGLVAAVGLVARGGVAVMPRYVRNRVFRRLRAAEAALRRLLVIAALSIKVELRAQRDGPRKPLPKGEGASGARMPSFPLVEALPKFGRPPARRPEWCGPRISMFDGCDAPRPVQPDAALPEDSVDADGLCHRLKVIQTVLEALPKHALRVARWQARRAASPKPCRLRPVRLGRPVGFCKRHEHKADVVLYECHALLLYALSPPNTS